MRIKLYVLSMVLFSMVAGKVFAAAITKKEAMTAAKVQAVLDIIKERDLQDPRKSKNFICRSGGDIMKNGIDDTEYEAKCTKSFGSDASCVIKPPKTFKYSFENKDDKGKKEIIELSEILPLRANGGDMCEYSNLTERIQSHCWGLIDPTKDNQKFRDSACGKAVMKIDASKKGKIAKLEDIKRVQ